MPSPQPAPTCAQCGAQSPIGSRFCPNCGASAQPSGLTNFTRVRQLFDQAMDIAPARRDAFLIDSCHGDPALLAELRGMILSADNKSFLQTAAPTLTAPPTHDDPSGTFIGPYRIVRELGRGGMGVVYLAMRDDGAFRKNVAIKLLLRDQVNPEFIQRFKQERQVLAALDHPNIARILDGGDAPGGMPYYVMEYVEGLPLDAFCDQQRLTLSARITIFQQVCHAVHYLHQNLIVHRDLKPNNILVSNDGVVKLLDFGIAKMVGAASLSSQELTAAQLRPMTPTYASPEQMQGATLQKTSDIYSLGVILYKLLTGRQPYEGIDDKIAKLAAREDPPLPSANIRPDLAGTTDSTAQRRRAMMGALDGSILMAMRYDPKHRYQSAADFAGDLQRFLDGQSMSSYREPIAIRSIKLLKRKRVAIAVLAGFLTIAAFGARQWERAETQKAEADRRQTQLRGVMEQLEIRAAAVTPDPAGASRDIRLLKKSFATDFTAAVAAHPGVSPERDALLNRGVRYLDRLRDVSTASPALNIELADAYQQLGLLRENDSEGRDRGYAADIYRKAVEVLTSLAAADPNNPAVRPRLDYLNQRIAALSGAPVTPQMAVDVPPPPPNTATPKPQRPSQQISSTARPQEQQQLPPPQDNPPPAPQHPVIPPAELRELDDDVQSVSAKIESADQSIEPIKQSLAAQGHSLDATLASNMNLMHARLDRARQDIADGNATAAREDLQAARAFAERVLKEVGR